MVSLTQFLAGLVRYVFARIVNRVTHLRYSIVIRTFARAFPLHTACCHANPTGQARVAPSGTSTTCTDFCSCAHRFKIVSKLRQTFLSKNQNQSKKDGRWRSRKLKRERASPVPDATSAGLCRCKRPSMIEPLRRSQLIRPPASTKPLPHRSYSAPPS
jgi:hypothetical protein